MSEELQKQFGLFAGEKVIYKNGGSYLSTHIVEDVTDICIREGEEFIGVLLEDCDGYVDFSDIITLRQALDYFGLEMIKTAELGTDKRLGVIGYIVEIKSSEKKEKKLGLSDLN